ncbi:Zn-dependent metalloprotease [Lewinella marina]|uniref:Uncharacterized protein n=1 Tax=Neolewinella marina TaxID=438751 RepID=A0A2G0CJG4_9BACT|nr:M4 family metallopeptidase [Neolewinella marina]NJB84724.1 Zn-dependent metalloprotease [Neolewinella marina]PHL00116.1 hypothetical protein CGL56_03480 [Neolewinella marina]
MLRPLLSPRRGLLAATVAFSALLSAQPQSQPLPAKYQELQARPEVAEMVMSEERQTPALVRFTPEVRQAQRASKEVIADLFQLDDQGITTTLDHTTRDKSGLVVERYQQYYRGVKVEHGRYNAVSNAEGLQLVSSEHYELDPSVKVQPTLSRDAALQRALDFVGAKQYAWEYIEDQYVRLAWSRDFLAHVQRELEEVRPGGELVIVDDYGTEAADPDLAWKFNVYASEPLSRAWIYVNAHSGKVMLKNPIIKHASDPVTVETRYAGQRTIMVDRQTRLTDPHSGLPLTDSRTNLPATGPLYVLRDDTRGNGLETYDLNGQGGIPLSIAALYAQGKAFTDDDLNWTVAEHRRGGEFNEAENDDIAWDAHWGTQMVYDYWLDVHGRRSYDDNDIAIKSFLHYGVAYDNAFWNGSAMTYGDGSYQGGLNPDGTFAPLMSLDVCGHEIGHAVCSSTSDLVYAKESGAMNEGFSDIWGAAIEAYVARAVDPSLADIMAPWGIGEQIDERDGGVQYPESGWRALRYMDEPNKAGDPDTYGGAFWVSQDCSPTLANDQCGVHTNSGVLNKWFYLLTEGEDGTNDNGDAYSVNGLGFEVSERIAYGTLLLLTPNATFAEARAASIAFVRSMNEAGGGSCGNYEEQLTNAWYGVGVGDAFNCAQVASFVEPVSFVSERITDASGCYVGKIIEVPAAVVNDGFVRLGGTAKEGVDYQVLNKVFHTRGKDFAVHTFQVEIYDDGFIEGDETIIMSLGQGSPHQITILDDEVPLTIGNGTEVLLENNMRNSSLPAGWSTTSFIDNGANGWYSSVVHGALVSPAVLGGVAPTPTYTGNDLTGDDFVLSSPRIDARGLHTVQVSFDWKAGGETDVPTGISGLQPVAVPLDYGNLAYSFDGEHWNDFRDFDPFVGAAGTIATGSFDDAVLPDFLEGTTFFLGWRWRNDALLNTAYSFSFENVKVTAKHLGIATKVTSAERRTRGNESVYYLTNGGKEVIAGFESRSAHIFGCTTMKLLTEGSGKNRCSGGIFLDKTYKLEATNFKKDRPITVRFFLTNEEIENFEQVSGKSRHELSVYHSTSYVCTPGTKAEKAALTYIQEFDGGIAFVAEMKSGGQYFSIGAEDNSLPFLQARTDGSPAAASSYPNPFTNELTVMAPGDNPAGTVRLFSLTGQLVKEAVVTGQRTTVSVSDLPTGAYLLRLLLDSGEHHEERVVKH